MYSQIINKNKKYFYNTHKFDFDYFILKLYIYYLMKYFDLTFLTNYIKITNFLNFV